MTSKTQYRDCVGGVANSPEGCSSIQRDLYKQSPAPEEEKTQAQMCTGGHIAGKQLDMKAPGGLGGNPAEAKAAVWPCSRR